MTLKDLLKKKDKVQAESSEPSSSGKNLAPDPPEFTFLRTTTTSQEVIEPPLYPGDQPQSQPSSSKRLSRFRRHTNSTASPPRELHTGDEGRSRSRLSDRLHLGGRSRSASTSSVNIPADIPEPSSGAAKGEDEEAQWEKRATLLAKSNPNQHGGSSAPSLSDATGDENIQEAIRLHEEGDLQRSTAMFGRLADPNGQNNALSQVLYGLALRHGWGITKDEAKAVTYLSAAAANSADIEALALQAGMKKGGAAKGELTLAIFELANCFRNGWGVNKDPIAAKQYYETAANMGDTDAMNEVAWCYLEGFGCKKDKYKAAQYLRLAEERGVKTLGNTWIWKDKYGGLKKD